MALRDAIARIQAHAISAGAKEAPTDPPESNAGFPFSVCYPGSGKLTAEASRGRRDRINILLDYHVSRQNLPLNVQAALLFLESFPNYLMNDPMLNGTVSTIEEDEEHGIDFVFGNMSYATVQTIGFRFTIPVKMRKDTGP